MVCLAVGIGAAAECAARRHAGPRMTSLMSAVHAFHFLRPWWLLALIPAWALCVWLGWRRRNTGRSEEHTSELQSLMRISYAVFCLKKKNTSHNRQPPMDNPLKIQQNIYRPHREHKDYDI